MSDSEPRCTDCRAILRDTAGPLCLACRAEANYWTADVEAKPAGGALAKRQAPPEPTVDELAAWALDAGVLSKSGPQALSWQTRDGDDVAGGMASLVQLRYPDAPQVGFLMLPGQTLTEALDGLAAMVAAMPEPRPPNPVDELLRLWRAAHRPPAEPDRGRRRILAQLERPGSAADTELTLPGMDAAALSAPVEQGHLPQFEPPPTWYPPAYDFLAGETQWATPSPAGLRVLRLMSELLSEPMVPQRVGHVNVSVTVHDLIRRLWPNDRHITSHYKPLLATIDRASVIRIPLSSGDVIYPVRPVATQRAGAIADGRLLFELTYPPGGGQGARFDRARFRKYGPNSLRFRTYFAMLWASDFYARRDSDGAPGAFFLTLDQIVRAAHGPGDVSKSAWRSRRTAIREALKKLGDDAALEIEPPAPHSLTNRINLKLLLPPPK